ncbi:MAG: magnesium transporter [Alphaproteobacteria bacterium]
MTEPTAENQKKPGAEVPRAEKAVGLSSDFVRSVVAALDERDRARVRHLIAPLHPADAADLIQRLNDEERHVLVEALHPEIDPKVLSELDETVRDAVIEQLGTDEVAAAVTELDTDDAVDLIEDLDAEVQQEVLKAIPAVERVMLETGLAYPEDSAGRLMQRELVAVPAFWSVGEVIDHLRTAEDLPDDFYDLFIVDPRHRPVGKIPLSRVLRTKRPVAVGDIMLAQFITVPVDMDQEEVAFLFRQRDLVSAPVVEADGRLMGVITVDDVVDVIDEEAEEDIMHLGGVTGDDLYRAVLATTRSRFSWLLVNLLTAIVASIVIFQFKDTIEKIVALAVLMPIVASMGGNAGTQTLTVSVRALATKELTPTNALRIVGKELLVGSFNGILFAILAGVVAWLWFDDMALGLVIAAAMIINLVVAGFAGTAIPIGLARTGIDPAVASTVLLTTITDVIGFLAFLGLAAWLLL